MYKVVKLGAKDVPMKASAATAIRYKQVFHKELLRQIRNLNEESLEVEAVLELAFIMAMSGEGKDMTKLSYDQFIDWLDGFETMDFLDGGTVSEIIEVWQGTQETTVDPKGTSDLPSAS